MKCPSRVWLPWSFLLLRALVASVSASPVHIVFPYEHTRFVVTTFPLRYRVLPYEVSYSHLCVAVDRRCLRPKILSSTSDSASHSELLLLENIEPGERLLSVTLLDDDGAAVADASVRVRVAYHNLPAIAAPFARSFHCEGHTLHLVWMIASSAADEVLHVEVRRVSGLMLFGGSLRASSLFQLDHADATVDDAVRTSTLMLRGLPAGRYTVAIGLAPNSSNPCTHQRRDLLRHCTETADVLVVRCPLASSADVRQVEGTADELFDGDERLESATLTDTFAYPVEHEGS